LGEPSLFAADGLATMLARIGQLRPDAAPLWGKMTLAQMLAHCQQPLRVATGELLLGRSLVGVLFGRLAKKQLLAPGPMKRNLPTAPQFKIGNPRAVATEQQALLDLVRRFGEAGPAGLTQKPHPFFGPLTADEWQMLQWKHLDHHLRQFGV
jgi:hypothetical protein